MRKIKLAMVDREKNEIQPVIRFYEIYTLRVWYRLSTLISRFRKILLDLLPDLWYRQFMEKCSLVYTTLFAFSTDGWVGSSKFFERNFLTRRFQYGNGNVNLTTRTTRFKQDESQIRFDLVTRRVQSKMNKTEHTPTVWLLAVERARFFPRSVCAIASTI